MIRLLSIRQAGPGVAAMNKHPARLPQRFIAVRHNHQAAAAVAKERHDEHVETIYRPNTHEYWREIPIWENVTADEFLSYRWGVSSTDYSLAVSHQSQIIAQLQLPPFTTYLSTLMKLTRVFIQIRNTVQGVLNLTKFLNSVLPEMVPYGGQPTRTQTREELIKDVVSGTLAATMAIRLTYVYPNHPTQGCSLQFAEV